MPWPIIVATAGTVAIVAYMVWRLATDRRPAGKGSPGLVLACLAIGAGIAFAVLISGDESEQAPAPAVSPAGQYPGPWRSDYRADIQRALSAAGAGACLFHYRPSITSPGEFLAYCPGGRAYVVWPDIGRAMGPLQLSADIPAPE